MGWPEGKKFALVLTHDVETGKGVTRCKRLAGLEEELEFRSCFNFVAEDYAVPPELRNDLVSRGFEVGVHGLHHRGNLFRSKDVFLKQAAKINQYVKEWAVSGFRSPSLYHNLEWIRNLDIEYDSSTFDTDPFEPQPDGVGTVFPFRINGNSTLKGYVEIPYTLPQDFTLFVIMKEKDIDVWKKKLDWIAEKGGMVLLITHPDYMNFNDNRPKIDEYPVKYYEMFLEYVKIQYEGRYWHALPKEMAHFCRSRLRK